MQSLQLRSPSASKAGPAAATPWHSLHQSSRRVAACSARLQHTSHLQTCAPASRPKASQARLQPQQQCRPVQQQQGQQQRGQSLQVRAGPIDSAPVWTLDQIAGLVFGAVMLAFYFSSNYVDVYIAKQQRKQLGLCERCGGLNDAATCRQDGCPMKSKAA